MGLAGPIVKYIVLIAVIAAFFYFRMIKGRRKPRQIHGRDRLHAAFKQRRRKRLASATTWEDRRALMRNSHGGRRIRPDLLSGRPGGASGGAAGDASAGGRAGGGRKSGDAGRSSPGAGA